MKIKIKLSAVSRQLLANRVEIFCLLLILLIGAFLRLYRISEYMTFLGDEGRDVMVVRRLIQNKDLVFVGPGTSVGNMYLGPLYYYLMAPALWMARFSPVGPAVQIALLGVVTIFLVWYLVRKWFPSPWGALFAAMLYAISPVVIIYSRSSWNPNIMPLFSLLTVYSLWKIWREGGWKWLLVLSFSFGFVTQSHYLGLILLPLMLVFYFLALKHSWLIKKDRLSAIWYSLSALVIFGLLTSPLIAFDAKYGWRNLKAFGDFFAQRTGSVSFNVGNLFLNTPRVLVQVMGRLLVSGNINLGIVLTAILIIGSAWLVWKLAEKPKKTYVLLLCWFLFGIIGLSLYQKEITDHYFGFLFPAPFILLGAIVGKLWSDYDLKVKIILIVSAAFLIGLNLYYSPIKNSPNRQLQRTVEVAQKIREESKDEPFNFAVIAERNYEGAHQYFLELWQTKLILIDPQKADETITEQLFVVCEYEDREKCQPTSNPKAQVANFGWSRIESKWEVGGAVLFKLVHNYSGR